MSSYIIIIIPIIVMCLILSFYLNRKINLQQRKKAINDLENVYTNFQKSEDLSKSRNISEWSYQRFANFFNQTELKDENFNEKISKIYDLIVNKKVIMLDDIVDQTGCTYEELILKIKYLKNKRKIPSYLYIDRGDRVIRECSDSDKKLLKKYEIYIYSLHLQPMEIAKQLPGATRDNLKQLEKKVIDDLSYLDDKYLISGMNIDKVDNRIIYYTIEKHRREKNYLSLNCSNCGALVEVPKQGKAKCTYCKNIVEDKEKKE